LKKDLTTFPPPLYFPIFAGPFRMTAGLVRMGHDFGNGPFDRLFFQTDGQAREYRAEKERILELHPDRLSALSKDRHRSFHLEALSWMTRQLSIEHGIHLPSPQLSSLLLHAKQLSLEIQEDFALLQETEEGADELTLISVCFPSGWRPETLLGASFLQTHSPVPEFGELAQKSSELVRAMTSRGPYVRFVWSLTAGARLDHHPEDGPRDPWSSEGAGYLRVERQVTVPFPQFRGSLFLIRTYVTPLKQLSQEQRNILYQATAALPPSIQAYKGLGPDTLEVLRRSTTS
jgi:hypothetical protein